jgi:hypothetical protein
MVIKHKVGSIPASRFKMYLSIDKTPEKFRVYLKKACPALFYRAGPSQALVKPPASGTLLGLAHKILKNRLKGDFFTVRIPKAARQPWSSRLFQRKSHENLPVQQAPRAPCGRPGG